MGMLKSFRYGLLAVCPVLAPTCSDAAVDVYSQAPSSSLADTSAVYNNPADPGFNWALDADMEAWAYFHVPTDVSLNRISWYGTDSDGAFAVALFAASCFSCSASWAQTGGTFGSNMLTTSLFGQSQVHKTALAGGLFSYYVDLPSSLVLSASSPSYGLSVVNNYTSLPFSWAASAQGSGFHLHYIVGQAMFLRAPGNLAFTLTDTGAVPSVPEPKGMYLAVTGAIFLWSASAVRRRSPNGSYPRCR
jgi:hypothetical protein